MRPIAQSEVRDEPEDAFSSSKLVLKLATFPSRMGGLTNVVSALIQRSAPNHLMFITILNRLTKNKILNPDIWPAGKLEDAAHRQSQDHEKSYIRSSR